MSLVDGRGFAALREWARENTASWKADMEPRGVGVTAADTVLWAAVYVRGFAHLCGLALVAPQTFPREDLEMTTRPRLANCIDEPLPNGADLAGRVTSVYLAALFGWIYAGSVAQVAASGQLLIAAVLIANGAYLVLDPLWCALEQARKRYRGNADSDTR